MDIVAQLKRDEGFVDHIYLDQVGKHTIGYGHNLDAKPISWIGGDTKLTEAQATQILAVDIADTNTALRARLPWVSSLDDARLGVLVNMSFNMGVPGLMAFKHMLAAVAGHQWDIAAQEMESSLWYAQVGVRAKRLVKQMLSGVWQ